MKTCSVREYQKAMQNPGSKKVAFVDVRTETEYAEGHIEGTVNIPLDSIEHRADFFCDYDVVYMQCRSGGRSAKAIEKLEGIQPELVNVEGGLLAWQAEGLPVKKNSKIRMPLMQQALLAAGLMNLLGLGLYAFITPYGIYWSLFVGLGLVFAGLTGWCGMSQCLMRMPWNS